MPLVIPVFIPHQGCPHACIFCNQHQISGQELETRITSATVRDTIALWLERNKDRDDEVQVAFYGGSFTGLPVARQEELLRAVDVFLQNGQVQSIRLSTRPDYITKDIVEFLLAHGVATVELGAQSLDDKVLAGAERGHTASDTQMAVEILKQSRMRTGLQVMLGLPGQTGRSLMQTTQEIVAMQPDFVRIYPVLVLRGSRLNTLYDKGLYKPLSLDKAVVQAAWMKKRFDAHGVKVVRMGLQPGPALEESLVAGPYHPAFGELVSARIMLQLTRKALHGVARKSVQILSISERDMSIFMGVNSGNMKRLKELGLNDTFKLIKDKDQPRMTLRKVTGGKVKREHA